MPCNPPKVVLSIDTLPLIAKELREYCEAYLREQKAGVTAVNDLYERAIYLRDHELNNEDNWTNIPATGWTANSRKELAKQKITGELDQLISILSFGINANAELEQSASNAIALTQELLETANKLQSAHYRTVKAGEAISATIDVLKAHRPLILQYILARES